MASGIMTQLDQAGLLALPGGVRRRGHDLVDAVGQTLLAETVQRAPVDTGNLAGSYAWNMTGEGEGELATAVEYAPAQEFGTVSQPGTPHVTPAVLAVQPILEAGLAQLVEGK